MAGDGSGHEESTRRECVKYGGAVVGGGLPSGCPGDTEPNHATPACFYDRVGVAIPTAVASPLSNGWDTELFSDDDELILDAAREIEAAKAASEVSE